MSVGNSVFDGADSREKFSADIRKRMSDAVVSGAMGRIDHDLKQIDRHLQLLYVDEETDTRGTPIKAGYFHVVRWNPDAPPTVIPIEDENGMPVEPGSRLFDRLRAGDIWDPRNQRRFADRQAKLKASREREKARETEARREELHERWNRANSTQIAFSDGKPMRLSSAKTAKRDAGESKKREASGGVAGLG